MTRFELALLYEQTNDGATTCFHVRFNNKSFCRNMDIGLEFLNISNKQYQVEQLINIVTRFGTHLYHNRVTAPFFWVKVVLGRKLRFNKLRIGGFLVDLIDSYDDLGMGVLSKSNRFNCLRL